MTVSKFVQPNYNTQGGTAYPLGIDAAFAAFLRLAGSFAPHESAQPNMTVSIDAGHVFNGTTLLEGSAQVSGTITAPVAQNKYRKDIVYVDRVNLLIGVATGTAIDTDTAADPAIPAGKVPVARVVFTAANYPVTAIVNSMLDDIRDLNLMGMALGQIPFPATQNASSDPNTLDDYEEGTYTPTLTFATPGDLSVAYAERVGVYTKIGRHVHVICNIVTSTFTHTQASGALSTIGLPFTAAGISSFDCATEWQGITKANYTDVNVRITGATGLWLTMGSGQGLVAVAASDMPTTGTVINRFGGGYHV